MNQPPNDPNSGMQTPPGYGAPPNPGYGAPGHSGPMHNSGSYPPPQSFRGATRQIFNPAAYRQPGSAAWGAASLIISLVSLILFCGFLSPLSLIFGLIGLVGKKRAKGAALAGVILSGLQIAFWVAVFAIAGVSGINTGGAAEEAGAPVVAAIEEFRADNERVPHNLQELVDQGYLPPTWSEGLDELDGDIRKVVEGKEWSAFLAYKPGEDATWEGTPSQTTGSGPSVSGDLGSWEIDFGDPNEGMTEYKTYGLTFIGMDGNWGTYDDAAVNQAPEEPYELTDLWGGDANTREIAQKRRQMKALYRKLEGKVTQYETAVKTASDKLDETRTEIQELRIERNLQSFDDLQADNRGKGLLKLAGQQQKLMLMARRKLENTEQRLGDIDIQIRLLENQEAMAKLADSPQELAELESLLEESEEVLDTGGDLGELDKLDENKAAQDWFNSTFK